MLFGENCPARPPLLAHECPCIADRRGIRKQAGLFRAPQAPAPRALVCFSSRLGLMRQLCLSLSPAPEDTGALLQ